MAKDPRAGELTTTNYGWTKPTVGGSDDAWGDQINANLDGIDSVVYGIQNRLGDNRIINGDMRIDQRNNGALATVSGYSTIDRWALGMSIAGKYTAQRLVSTFQTVNGFPYVLSLASTSAYSPVTSDSLFVSQAIEADMTSDFAWGTAGAQPVTLSFWVNVSFAGTYSGAITNFQTPPTRSYPFSFTVPLGWTKVVVTIPGDTAGTWVMNGNTVGVILRFDMGSGSTFHGPAGAWVNGNLTGATGSAGIVTTNGAFMQITGVKLEIGSVATPFNRQSLARSMLDCQRYYQIGQLFYQLSGQAAGATLTMSQSVPVQMRATPTTVVGNNVSSNFTLVTLGFNNICLYAAGTVPAAGVAIINTQYTASAEL
jgi:hypothetical protein